jgi:hypothetical protein
MLEMMLVGVIYNLDVLISKEEKKLAINSSYLEFFTASSYLFFQSFLSSHAFEVNLQFHTGTNQGPFSSFTAFLKHLRSSLSISSSLLHLQIFAFSIHVRVLLNTFTILQRDIFSWLSFSIFLARRFRKSICFSSKNTDVRFVPLDMTPAVLIYKIEEIYASRKKLAIASNYSSFLIASY